MLYCALVTNVVYDNFQDILFPAREVYSALGNTRNSLRASLLHFNYSSMQLKQQTSGHNNIPLMHACIQLTSSSNTSIAIALY